MTFQPFNAISSVVRACNGFKVQKDTDNPFQRGRKAPTVSTASKVYIKLSDLSWGLRSHVYLGISSQLKHWGQPYLFPVWVILPDVTEWLSLEQHGGISTLQGNKNSLCSSHYHQVHCKLVFCPWGQVTECSRPFERLAHHSGCCWTAGIVLVTAEDNNSNREGCERFWLSHFHTDSKWLSVTCLEENCCPSHEMCDWTNNWQSLFPTYTS